MDGERGRDLRRTLALVQGSYFLLGGAWPWVHMRSFELVTGPKTDDWLVRTVAGLLLVIGGTLVHGVVALRRVSTSLRTIAFGSAVVLGSIAVVSSLAQWISGLYLLDGIIHLVFAGLWLIAWRRTTS